MRKDEKILFARRINTGYQDGMYQMPAGHVDPGELPSEAGVREAKEEIGIDIKPEDMKHVHSCFRRKLNGESDRADYYFEAMKWSGEITNCEPEKCDDLKWVDPHALPDNTVAHIRTALEAIDRGAQYSELRVGQ